MKKLSALFVFLLLSSALARTTWEYAIFSDGYLSDARYFNWRSPDGLVADSNEARFYEDVTGSPRPLRGLLPDLIFMYAGEQGWELVSVVNDTVAFYYYFKRER